LRIKLHVVCLDGHIPSIAFLDMMNLGVRSVKIIYFMLKLLLLLSVIGAMLAFEFLNILSEERILSELEICQDFVARRMFYFFTKSREGVAGTRR
jgi:hypothetical protein